MALRISSWSNRFSHCLPFRNSKESSTTVANVVLPKSKTTPAPIKFGPKPYFMKDGTVYPEPAVFNEEFGRRDAILLPEEDPDAYDRFENQLMFVPPNYHETRNLTKNKTIVVYSGYAGWWGIEGPHMSTWFTDHKCPVNTCKFSMNKSDAETADLVLFGAQYDAIKIKRTPNQIYAFYRMESPIHYSTKFPRTFETVDFVIFSLSKIISHFSISHLQLDTHLPVSGNMTIRHKMKFFPKQIKQKRAVNSLYSYRSPQTRQHHSDSILKVGVLRSGHKANAADSKFCRKPNEKGRMDGVEL